MFSVMVMQSFLFRWSHGYICLSKSWFQYRVCFMFRDTYTLSSDSSWMLLNVCTNSQANDHSAWVCKKKKKIQRKSKNCPVQCLYYRQRCNMNPCYPAFSNNPQINSTLVNPDDTNCHWLILNMQAKIKLVQIWGKSDL